MHSRLSDRVLATIRRHRMIRPGNRVGVAVSGGGDSVALLYLLEDLRETLGAPLVVVHFNHLLRGEAAEADEEFVRELAAEHGLECLVRREDVAAAARQAGSNVEEEARERRYSYFRELVRQGRVDRIATGHTADDQAETVLGRLLRGTGLRGLAAIHPVWGPVVRPLLGIRREELRADLAARGQRWQEDETNVDTGRFRARIRLRLLPALEAEFGASVTQNLTRLADLARSDEALLEEIVEERFQALARREGSGVALRARDLTDPWPVLKSEEARQAIAGRLVRRALVEVKGNLKRLTAHHVEQVLELAESGTSGKQVELPAGLVVERELERVVFLKKSERKRTGGQEGSYSYLTDPRETGEAEIGIAETGKRVRLKLIDWPAAGRETYLDAGALDADRLEFPLVVRNWLPGDAYRPHGRGHTEKLKRLLLERRISGRDRAVWPVLTSGGRPVWAAGLAVATECAAGPETRRALLVDVTGDGSSEGERKDSPGDAKSRGQASNLRESDMPGRRGVATGPERGRL
jgi:tRNA(Ile)-lysidine synthase